VSWTEPAFAAIADLLTPEYGLAFPPARRAFAEAAIRRAIASAHERTPVEYLARIRSEPALLRTLIAEITIGETYFFRDPLQFDVIRKTVVPERSPSGMPTPRSP
jgi:chemotaxis protein methyltransferase CheR